MNAVIDLPFALPTIVAGLVLLALYGPRSPIGVHLAFTRSAIFMALLFVTLPFVVRTVQPVLLELDTEMEEAARSLGASEFTTFRRDRPAEHPPGDPLGDRARVRAGGRRDRLARPDLGQPAFHTEVASVFVLNQVQSGDRAAAASVAVVLLAISFAMLLIVGGIRRFATRHENARRLGLRTVALGYLGIVLLGPLVMIFWKTFEHGVGPFWDAVSAHDSLTPSRTDAADHGDRRAAEHGLRDRLSRSRSCAAASRGRGVVNAFIDLPLGRLAGRRRARRSSSSTAARAGSARAPGPRRPGAVRAAGDGDRDDVRLAAVRRARGRSRPCARSATSRSRLRTRSARTAGRRSGGSRCPRSAGP